VQKTILDCVQYLQCKLIYNAASTGGHILLGKIAQNRMIDVKVSNSKLFERGLLIVQEFGKCSREEAKSSILKSIYETDHLTQDISDQVFINPYAHQVSPKLVCVYKDENHSTIKVK
jgi:hypothetical protein